MSRQFYVYMMASKYGVLYIGVTGDLYARVLDHKSMQQEGFTNKYKCTKLVYYEFFTSIHEAIEREKQLKKWRREKKEALIKAMNSGWRDLFEEFKDET